MKAERRQVLLHITLLAPPAGVTFCMQDRDNNLSSQTVSTGADLTFHVPIELDGVGRAFGKFAMGPPAQRFVYINSGNMAGQGETCWSRRAKIPITNLPMGGAHLVTQIKGTARDGGPCCATVPLVVPWRVEHNI